MKRKTWQLSSLAFLAVLLFSPPAYANVAVPPLFFLSWVAMVLALLPIVVIETIVLSVRAGTSLWESVLSVSVANLTSTLIGIPAAVILHAMFRGAVDEKPERLETAWQKFRMVVWHVQYVWLYDGMDDYEGRIREWMWPAGCLVLMVPFFLASWLTESWVVRNRLDAYPATQLDQAVFEANLLTYGLLVALLSALLVLAIRDSSLKDASHADRKPVSELDDPRRIADRRTRRGIARLKAKEDEIARRYQARPMHSPDLYKSWRLANEHARRGIATLRAAETIIDRQRLTRTASDDRRLEDARDDEAA